MCLWSFLQLEGNFLQYINSLLQDSGTDFWETGRFLAHTDKQIASHKDGELCYCLFLFIFLFYIITNFAVQMMVSCGHSGIESFKIRILLLLRWKNVWVGQVG